MNICSALNGQNSSRFSIHSSYGLNGNFFVRTFDEEDGPQPHQYFYKKNFLGTIGGVGLAYTFRNESRISVEYNRSINKGKKDFNAEIDGVQFYLRNFRLSFINNFFQASYQHCINIGSSKFYPELGVAYVTTNDQSISIDGGIVGGTLIDIQETSLKYTGSEEAGVLAGFEWQKNLNGNFDISLRARVYYLVSIGMMEAITLAPVLRYRF